MEFIKSTPGNVNELVKKTNDSTSWKKRMSALEELSKYDCQQLEMLLKDWR